MKYYNEEANLLGYKTLESVEGQPTFCRNVSPATPRLEITPDKKPTGNNQRRLTFDGLNGVITQMIESFITTGM
jgi:hypothetical protein